MKSPSQWPAGIASMFHFYHLAVFIWITVGLAWLGGLISILIEKMCPLASGQQQAAQPKALVKRRYSGLINYKYLI